MKAGFRRTIALALGLCALTIPASAASTFSDVPSSYWGYSYITEAASKGLVSGIGNGKYGPEDTLSNAQFVTMVCNMFYSDLVKAQGTSADWWRPYMNVAQATGLLSGTTAGNQYAASGAFTAANANGQISRYDMAQIMYNVSTAQRWATPDSMSLVLSQLLIQDFATIPTNYQMAVAYCYAKGFLSGDENGNFNGASTTTRAQAAVVLCSLNKAKTQVTAPTYTNSNRLSNGLVATEENVADLVDDLWAEYPDYDQWNMSTTYTSQRLGSGTGSKAFAYMLSDKIFGGMPANQIDDPADLRIGDVISLNSGSQYGVVCEADEDTFTYVACDSSGWVSWKNDMYRDDLDRYDTVWTRYLNMPEPDNVLSNGKDATKTNVEDLLDDLKKDKDYKEGADWDWDYEYDDSEVFGSATGSQGFAYCLSDEIFGDLEAERVDNEDDLRIGDVIYDSGEGLYGIVWDIDYKNETYDYVSLDDSYEEVSWKFVGKFSDLNLNRTYTRYPEDADYDYDDRDDDTLSNGKAATESNVKSLMNDLEDSRTYGDGEYWDDSTYTSDVLGKGRNEEGFAFALSDEIFADLEDYEETKISRLKLGDIVYDEDGYVLGVVAEIDEDYGEARCVSLDRDDEIDWNVWVYLDEIDTIISRYP